jgi:UDP-N-acetylmuramate dehydrogenase
VSIEKNVPLAKFSSLKIGGPADFFARVSDEKDLVATADFARRKKLRILIGGSGTNCLFCDAGFRGIFLKIENRGLAFAHKKINRSKTEFAQISAGENLAKFVAAAAKRNWEIAGLAGIPGTVGGAIAGNAGAHGCEISDIFQSARIFDLRRGKFFTVRKNFFQFFYRDSALKNQNNFVIFSATFARPQKTFWQKFRAKFSRKTSPAEEISQIQKKRAARYPFGAGAGSFFKNPPGKFAGELLEKSGVKNLIHGGAVVSSEHANFFLNSKNATAVDFLNLAVEARRAVFKKFKIELQPEVLLLDEFGEKIEI